jgi:hypothetical protein
MSSKSFFNIFDHQISIDFEISIELMILAEDYDLLINLSFI